MVVNGWLQAKRQLYSHNKLRLCLNSINPSVLVIKLQMLSVRQKLSSESLGFFTFSVVQYSRDNKTRRFGNWICFRPQLKGKDTYLVRPLRKS
jgi:hypothetical protein